MKNTNILTIAGVKDTVPLSKVATGTGITSFGTKIVGAGTLFATEVRLNDWIYIQAQNAVRRVENILSDTELTIDEAFATPLTNSPYRITPASRLKEISGLVNGTAAITVDGSSFSVGNTFEFNKMHRETSWSKDFIDPIAIDATALGASVKLVTNS